MAGVDFNREVFAKTSEPAPRPAQRGAGFVILAVVLGVLAVLGYKILSESRLLPADHAAGKFCSPLFARDTFCSGTDRKRSF